MKKCTVGWFSKIAAFAVIVLFFVPLTGLFVYLAFQPSVVQEERMAFLAGAAMFGALIAFAAYRVLYLGLVWVEYDAETVIFHCSRRESHAYSWAELPGERVQVGPGNGGYVFCIQGNKRQWTLPFNRLCRGYRDFEKMLAQAGVLTRIGVVTDDALRQMAEQMFDQFEEYKAVHPHSVRPMPSGPCAPCPDCQGRGMSFKKVLNIQVGKVCKTCGGSGYIAK